MNDREMANASAGSRSSALWAVVSEPLEIELEEYNDEFVCEVHGVFDSSLAAESYKLKARDRNTRDVIEGKAERRLFAVKKVRKMVL